MENIQRKSLLGIRIDCLNGDKFKTGKLTPEGDSAPRAFSTESNREGFQIGTAIALMAKGGNATMGLGRLKAVQHAETDPRSAQPRHVVPATQQWLGRLPEPSASAIFGARTNTQTCSPTKARIRISCPLRKLAIPSCPASSPLAS
jgi:hypothetical protein